MQHFCNSCSTSLQVFYSLVLSLVCYLSLPRFAQASFFGADCIIQRFLTNSFLSVALESIIHQIREKPQYLVVSRLELLTGFVRSAARDGIGEQSEPSQFRCRVAASKKDIPGASACSEMSINGAANRICKDAKIASGIGERSEPSQFRCRVAASKKDISGALACSEMSANGAANRICKERRARRNRRTE